PGTAHDPTFDAAHHEAPAPSLGYRQASAPPPPGASNDLPPGYLTPEEKARERKKQRRRRRLGMVVLALILLVAALATIANQRKKNAPKSLADVEEGECYLGDDLNDLEIVDCRAEHHGELFKILPAADPDGPFPDDAAMQLQRDTCTVELTAFFGAGADVALRAGFELFPITPSEAQWEDGHTDTYCVVGKADGSAYKGSLKNAGAGAG
ncbi:MAG TPA: septum formation family protein, partial [Acidimicrobiales bacterium]